MSTSNKLLYLNTTKTKIREGLNTLGADLDTEDTFRSYADAIENIYEDYPKITGEGESLTLDNTKQAPMKIDYKGNTSQDGTPTPDTPIPVNVVSGDNELNVEGKNLLRYDLAHLKDKNTTGTWNNNVYTSNGLTITINKDLSIKINGTSTAQETFFINNEKIYFETGTYYLSGSVNGSNTTYDIRVYNFNGSSIAFQCLTGAKEVPFVNNNQFFNVAIVVRNGQTLNNVVFYPMIAKTNDTTYEPYNGDTYNINLPVENLLPITLTNQTKNNIQVVVNDDKSITLNGTANAGTNLNLNYTSGSYVSLVSGETYTISIKNNSGIYFRLAKVSDNTNVATFDTPNKSVTFTSNYTGDCYAYITILNNTTLNNLTMYPIIQKGSKITGYSPYGTIPIELCKIGNYQDYFYKDSGKWYLHKEIAKYTFTGSENFSVDNNNRWYSRLDNVITNALIVTSDSASNETPMLLNKFIGTYQSNVNSIEKVAISKWGSIVLIYFAQTNGFSSTTDLLSALSGTDLYYSLATPTNTEITYQPLIDQLNELEKAMSKDGQTNISQENNDLPFILDVKALRGE